MVSDRNGGEEFDWHGHDQMGLWEHQGGALRIRDLIRQGGEELLDLPVTISVYDGVRASAFLTPMHVDFTGPVARPTGIVITVQHDPR